MRILLLLAISAAAVPVIAQELPDWKEQRLERMAKNRPPGWILRGQKVQQVWIAEPGEPGRCSVSLKSVPPAANTAPMPTVPPRTANGESVAMPVVVLPAPACEQQR
jgi:hypothetical protein